MQRSSIWNLEEFLKKAKKKDISKHETVFQVTELSMKDNLTHAGNDRGDE